MEPSADDLARIRDLYSQGYYCQAYEVARRYGPIREWRGTAARLLGGRLAIQLGAVALGRRLHLAAYRAAPSHPEAIYYHARYRLERFGPLSTWEFMRRHPDWSVASPELQGDWYALAGYVAARLRDFDRAESWLNRADVVAPDRPWPCIERSGVYELADRPEDALAAARRSLELHPWFRPGVQSVGLLLYRLGREREALDLLTEADARLESSLVTAQLAVLQTELGHYTDARRSLDRYAELAPLMEPSAASWLAARRADLDYLCGRYADAARHARAVGDTFYTAFAGQLEGLASEPGADPVPASAPSHSFRRLLTVDVGGTPPPSVYELLARFWRTPLPNPGADWQPPADGLPDAAGRAHAERHGWVAREFTLSVEAADALLARGLPFIVTLVEAGFSQDRLCLGADRIRGSIWLADGTSRHPLEAPVAHLRERFAAYGPRCLVLVPAAATDRLAGLALPDAEAREALYAVQKPLLTHDRAAAVAARDRLADRFPEHPLTRFADLALARYDAHPVKLLALYDRLLSEHPHEATWVLAKAAALRELNRQTERLALLEAEGGRRGADPLVMQSLAQALLPLPHRQAEAVCLLRRSVRLRPGAAAGYYLLATQWWEHRRFAEAAELYRFAFCLDDREEQFAEAYSRAASVLQQDHEAMRLFNRKSAGTTLPSPAAARVLYYHLIDLSPNATERTLQAVIDKLLHPGGSPAASERTLRSALAGELLLFRAECHAAAGRTEQAQADLAAARPLVPALVWHKAAARVARIEPDLAAAAAHLLEVVKLDPLNAEAHRTLVALLAATDGRAAARTHLAQACQRFPHSYPLLRLRAEFLSGDPQADADRAVRDMLAICPDDAWAHRQRALILADAKRLDEARAVAEQGGKLEPGHPWYYAVLSQVHKRADRIDEAREALRTALRHNIDQELLVAELMQLSRGRAEKRAALDFLAAELRRQPHTGEGLLAFVEQARQVYTEAEDHLELLATLEAILDERPDLWQAWSVVIQQLVALMRHEEAYTLAREATDRFPLLARLWLDRAQVCQALGQSEDRLESLRRAVAVAPGWSVAARELAEALREAGEDDEAVGVLERAATRSPLDPFAHGFLAELLWEVGRAREALDRAKRAVRHEPVYDWAWHAIQVWAERLEVPDEPAELARELTRERPGDPRVWLRLARLLHHPRFNDEALAALDRAIALDPKNVEAHDLKAERLAEMGRFDEALAAAQPPELAPDLPFVLQGRLAWVEARRGNYAAAIPPMQALVAIDPNYLWGWHQLAEWYNETGRPQNYLEAASELVRLQPGHPVALVMRGEARLQTGDRPGGKADLREALRISPGYSLAAALLFDACLADEEYHEARQALAVLQEHAAGPEVAYKQLQLAARCNDSETALRSFAEICEGPGQTPYVIQSALRELREAGWEDQADLVLRKAWQEGRPFQPWVPVFWIESADGQAANPVERLRAAEACIKAYPKFVPGHDCKAEQLALVGRFEEALAACRPADLDPPPIELRGRAAWVEYCRGERGKAITLMRQVVTDNPDFVPGWRQLASWYDAAGRYRECLEACEQFVRLEPMNPMAYVYRGEARRSLADRRGALADFQHALELDPTFEAAGLNLITEQLATGDVAAAARTLASVSEHSDGPLVRLRAVQVACGQGKYEPAAARFRQLAQDPEAGPGVLREAVAAFDAQGWGNRLTDELRELAFAPDANPDLAGLWAERAAAADPQFVAERLPELLAVNPVAGREAVVAYVGELARAGKSIQGLATQYSELLRSHTSSWARVGATLVAAGSYAYAVAWLHNWRERDGVEAWMLRPLAVAYRAIDQNDKAVEVCRAGLRLGGSSELLADFCSWVALDLALSGQIEEAARYIGRIDTPAVSEEVGLVLALARAVIMVARAGPGGKTTALAEAKDHIRAAAAAFPDRRFPPGMGRVYQRVVRRLAGDAGTPAAWLWAWGQRFAPWIK